MAMAMAMAMLVGDQVGKLLFFNMQVKVVEEAVDVSDPICWETSICGAAVHLNCSSTAPKDCKCVSMVGCENSGTRWLLSTYFLSCTSPSEAEAEVKAPKCDWKIVFWNVGACKLVREVLGVSDRICWETRYDILSLRRSFARPDWLLEWSPRETHVLADLAAKFSLVNGCNI
ncbi:hypothetical protein FNV43_RR20866 [Rhamnella rubrinervis]|uniref:Uncharacterized protein n=1 Tax=Rhamnella rubrinervis TaxID=2594499 RepID=A0A8K0DVL7_9ROSA|nr:hypothetical protein FNV43_RR20866 [Rhamnella rubrinervis]